MTGRRPAWRVVLSLVRYCPLYFAGDTLFAVVTSCLVVLPLGLVSRAFFDALAGGTPVGLNAPTLIALLVGIQLVEQLAGPALVAPWSPLQQKAQALLQHNLFAAILRGYGRDGLPEPIGETLSRFRDDPEIVADALDALADLIGRTCFALVAFVVMWWINPTITAVLFVPLMACSLVTELLEGRIKAYRRAAREATGRLTGFLGELLGGHLAVSAAGAVPNAIARLVDLGEARRRVAVRDSVFARALDALNWNLVHVGTGVVLLLGAGAMRDGAFTVGDFALFVVYLDQLTWYPAEVGRIVGDLKRIDVSLGRMGALVPCQPPAALVEHAPIYLRGAPPPDASPPPRERLRRLDVRGLSFAHADGPGIADASFAIERGSFTVVAGRVGAGKTTLLELLLGLRPRAGGEIRWNGRPVDDPATFFVPPRSAYTPQVPRLFSETLRENLLLGWPADDAALLRAIRGAVLEDDLAAFERGLDTLVGPRGVRLSGGQLQRAAAARMFVRESELLVFDDLSSALDAETEAELWSRLVAHGREITCLVVSNRPAALRRADQLLLVEEGRVTVQRPPGRVG